MKSTVDPEQWRAAYRATTESLECIRAREIASITDEEALRLIESLVVPGSPWRERSDWSGLIEQQTIFHRSGRS